MSTKSISIKDVAAYLSNCDQETLQTYFRILGFSKQHKPSAPYVSKEIAKVDPSSPVISWLQQNNNSEKAWAELMSAKDEIEAENTVKPLYST